MVHNNLNYRPAIKTRFIILLMLFTTLNFSLFTSNSHSQWYAQTLPVNPEIIYCMRFWNINTGWMSTGNWQTSYIPKILKTTNGGNNWFIIKDSLRMWGFQLIDSVTIYGRVRNVMGDESIYRSFNGGYNWDSVAYGMDRGYHGLYFFNKDTGYVGATDSFWGYMYKTTNGGITLSQLHKNDNPSFGNSLIFFKDNISGEYFGYCTGGGAMYKTTNSGYNWIMLNGLYNSPLGAYFLNKDTGWVSNIHGGAVIQHTTNGGVNWINQFTTLFNNYYPCDIYFSSYNKGWAGADAGNLVFATTNGGIIWGKQIVPQYRTSGVFFLDSLTGWCYLTQVSKTINGGGVIIGIKKDSSLNNYPNNYSLNQNYPNPFNGFTIIEYNIINKVAIGINIYDITGKSIYDMTANNQEPGNYKLRLDFGSLNLPSGVYFYKFIVVDKNMERLYSETKKMMYVK